MKFLLQLAVPELYFLGELNSLFIDLIPVLGLFLMKLMHYLGFKFLNLVKHLVQSVVFHN